MMVVGSIAILLTYAVLKVGAVAINNSERIKVSIPPTIQRVIFSAMACVFAFIFF